MKESERAEGGSALGEKLLRRISDASPPNPRKLNFPRFTFGVTSPFQVLLLASLSGLSGAGVLMALTAGIGGEDGQPPLAALGVAFVALILTYRWLQLTLMRSTSAAVEDALDKIRTRIAEKVAHLDLCSFEDIPKEELMAKMSRHYEVISESVVGVLGGLQSIALLVVVLVYLAFISLPAALLSVVVLGIGVQAYFGSRSEIQSQMKAASDADVALLGSVNDIARGFKELRLDVDKRWALLDELTGHSGRSAIARVASQGLFSKLFVFSNTIAFLLGGTVVFAIPILLGADYAQDMGRIVTVVLFTIGPLSAIVGAAQHFGAARFAIASLQEFEAKLDTLSSNMRARDVETPDFSRLSMKGVTYAHKNGRGFAVGPIDFELAKGEVVFLTGGNGSGKTTALRVLTGLYPADTGQILISQEPLSKDERAIEEYRHLFGAIFADVHVFRKPYALSPDRIDRFKELLERFELKGKLPEDLSEGYDPDSLSTGQRKRLAMAVTLAEDRPVMVFDEWAADQDPQFRRIFYNELLPELRARGKAIIAVTHDDRFFDQADRRYHMEEGRMTLFDSE